jgi:hypothetical protein
MSNCESLQAGRGFRKSLRWIRQYDRIGSFNPDKGSFPISLRRYLSLSHNIFSASVTYCEQPALASLFPSGVETICDDVDRPNLG